MVWTAWRGKTGWVLVTSLAAACAAAQAGKPVERTVPAAFPQQSVLFAADAALNAPSETGLQLARRILGSGDHAGLPFAVVDKRAASLLVFHGDGRLAGSTPVLLGATPGDQSTSDVGLRTQTGRLRDADRTTPAGRFEGEPGHNLRGEAVVWIDYAKAFAIHRLRPGLPQEQRAERLASPTPADNRISAGCVVVPVAFYESVVDPLLGRGRSVFYVMPEGSAPSRTVASLR